MIPEPDLAAIERSLHEGLIALGYPRQLITISIATKARRDALIECADLLAEHRRHHGPSPEGDALRAAELAVRALAEVSR